MTWLALALSLIAATVSGGVRAQSYDELGTLNRQLDKLHSNGKDAEAVPLAERYVALARQRYGEEHSEYATAITWLGSLYGSQGRYAEAETLLKQALFIGEKAQGPGSAQAATSLSNLAALYELQGRHAEAEPLLERAVSIREKALDSDQLDALYRKIEKLHENDADSEALPLAERYLALAGQRYGEEHPQYVSVVIMLGSIYGSQGRYAEAENLLKRSLSIREKVLGPDHLKVSDSLDALARLYELQGRYAEAEQLLKRAVSIREKVLGPDHLKVSDSLEALARLYKSQGRHAESERLLERALSIREKALVPKSLPQHYGADRLPSYEVVKVFYGTDRKKTSGTDPAKMYGRDQGKLALGVCAVSIPRGHKTGELESPSVWRFEWSEDPEEHVVLLSVTEKEEPAFYQEVVDRVRQSAGKNAFLFVHGYNVTFAEAARRTAQMARDLNFDGAPVFYSWPSQEGYASYNFDQTNAEWSQFDLKTFLRDFAERSEAENIFLVAHSMGARVLTGALKDLMVEYPAIRPKLREIILAAPDIDADTFKRDIAPRILTSQHSATLYASSEDYALMASKRFAGYRRAGDTAGGVTVAENLETIDATGIETDFFGHSYYAESESILEDLRNLILFRQRAEKRSALTPVESAAGRYWAFSR